MKLVLTMLVALTVAGSAVAATNNATLTIKHQTHGCHSWSLDGKSWHATQRITIVRGGVLAVVDNDVMSHKLIQVSGPQPQLAGTTMNHMGATAYVGFRTRGTYVFKTRAGEDYGYAKGIKTVGEDNILKLVVTVT